MNPLFETVSSWITYRTSGVDDVTCESESMERRPAAGACDRAALFRKRDESRPRGMAQRAAAGGRGVPMAHQARPQRPERQFQTVRRLIFGRTGGSLPTNVQA